MEMKKSIHHTSMGLQGPILKPRCSRQKFHDTAWVVVGIKRFEQLYRGYETQKSAFREGSSINLSCSGSADQLLQGFDLMAGAKSGNWHLSAQCGLPVLYAINGKKNSQSLLFNSCRFEGLATTHCMR